MAPMVWSYANNEKLLVYLLASNPSIKLDFDGAAEALSNDEQPFTARAVQERFKKIKRTVMEDPKWVTLAEQAAQGHGQSINRKRYAAGAANGADSDSEAPLITHNNATSTRVPVRQNNSVKAGSAQKKRKIADDKAGKEKLLAADEEEDDD